MFQSVGHEVIDAFAECMNLPLYRRTIVGSSKCTTLEYTSGPDDEVEDLYELLSTVVVCTIFVVSLVYLLIEKRFVFLMAKSKHPDIKAVSCGAILSSYQRIRVENVYVLFVSGSFRRL